MYSKGSWGGSVEPFILTKFDNSSFQGDKDAIISFVIFEWRDEHLIGVPATNGDDLSVRSPKLTIRQTANLGASQKERICYDDTIKAGLCNQTQIGEFILQRNASQISKNAIITQAVNLKNPTPINYPVKKTGYYCVWTHGYSIEDYRATVTFRNSYGELPAAQIAKLPFYGGLTIVYAVIGA